MPAPTELVARWARERPLACLVSAGGRGSRWSIFAEPVGMVVCRAQAGGSTRTSWTPLAPDAGRWTLDALPDDPLALLDAISPDTTKLRTSNPLPFVGGWIGALSYDLGRLIEPSALHKPRVPAPGDWPLVVLLRCPRACIHDALSGTWHWVALDHRSAPEAAEWMYGERGTVSCSPATSDAGHTNYASAVAAAVELIRDGHAFQVNLAHQLACAFAGSPRNLMAALLSSAAPSFGAYLELGRPDELDAALCSISPELFLDVDFRSGSVLTRPIKGTRAAADATGHDELAVSEKDRAELAMIVDLMRNDLGRVCDFGSVRVADARSIERHGPARHHSADSGALYHASAAVAGRLTRGVGLGKLIRATFPPGSVTGAPKVRAMQIIDELEVARRGPYCGCIGFVSEHGRSAWNVAIRTALLSCEPGSTASAARGRLTFPVGAGIVADSDPESEWHETMAKAAMFLKALGHHGATLE